MQPAVDVGRAGTIVAVPQYTTVDVDKAFRRRGDAREARRGLERPKRIEVELAPVHVAFDPP